MAVGCSGSQGSVAVVVVAEIAGGSLAAAAAVVLLLLQVGAVRCSGSQGWVAVVVVAEIADMVAQPMVADGCYYFGYCCVVVLVGGCGC